MLDGLRGRVLATTSKFAYIGNSPGGVFSRFGSWMGQNDGGGGNETQSGGNDTQAGGSGTPGAKSKTDTGTDTGADDALVTELWNAETGNKGKQDDPAGGNPVQPVAEPDPDKQVANYLKENGIEPIVLNETELEAFKSGEGVQATLDKINQRIVNGHIKAVSTANELIKKQVADAVKKAVGDSATLLRDDKARDAMRAALPWAKSPEFAPVAETVLNRFLVKSNNDIPKSVLLTKLYFEKQAAAMDPDAATANRNLGGNNRQGTSSAKQDTNWIDVLKGK